MFHPLKLKNLHIYPDILQQFPPQSLLLRTSFSLVSLSSSSCQTLAFLFSWLKSVKIPLLMQVQSSVLVMALVYVGECGPLEVSVVVFLELVFFG